MNHSPLTEDRSIAALEPYSFSDEAAQLLLEDHPQLKIQYGTNIGDVWKAIMQDNALGMIPFENSSGGVVWPHLERLMKEQKPLHIAASVLLRVRMCAGGVLGTTLENTTHVHSHPKGLEQTTRFLETLPASSKKVECTSTVEGTRRAAEMGKGGLAIASQSAIEAAGLEVLAEDIADLPGSENVTKFFVVHTNGGEPLPDVQREFHAAIITPNEHIGVLADITNQMRNSYMNLVSIHSRSIGVQQYAFFMEMERRGNPEDMKLLDYWLQHSHSVKSVKWLGSWDERMCNYPLWETPHV